MLKKFPKLPNQLTHLSGAKYTKIQMRAYGIRCIQEYIKGNMQENQQPKLCKDCVNYPLKATRDPCDSCLKSGKAINWVEMKSIASDTIEKNQSQ